MALDGTGAGAFGKIGMAEALRRFEDILFDRLRKTVRGDQFKLLFTAHTYDGASEAAPSSVRPDLFAGAGLFALEDRRISHGGRKAQRIADADDRREAVRCFIDDSGSRVPCNDSENPVGFDNE